MRRAHHRHGKAVLPVLLHQPIFAGDLVARVLPEGVGQGCRFRDPVMGDRLLVRRGGADEDVLPRLAAKQLDISFYLIDAEGEPTRAAVDEILRFYQTRLFA